jgi:hypothetical protein
MTADIGSPLLSLPVLVLLAPPLKLMNKVMPVYLD